MPVAVPKTSHHSDLNYSLIFQYRYIFPFQSKSGLVIFVLLYSWLHSSLTAPAGQTPTLSTKLSSSMILLSMVGESHRDSQAETTTDLWSLGPAGPISLPPLFPHLVFLKANPNSTFLFQAPTQFPSHFLSTHDFAFLAN